MTLAELLAIYEDRRRVAEQEGSQAPVSGVYAVVLNELTNLDGIDAAGRWYDTQQAADVLSLSTKTVRRWCNGGRFPSAHRTGGASGEWRIPALEIHRNLRENDRKKSPKLWEAQ